MRNLLWLFLWLLSLRGVATTLPGDSLSVDLVTPGRSLDPGKLHNLVFMLTNHTSDTLAVTGTITLPPGLRLAIPPRPLLLSPGQPSLLMASISIPSRFASGRYTLKAVFTSSLTGRILADTETEFLIPERDGISFELLSAPAYVRAGETFTASWILRNNGNTTRRFTVTTAYCDAETPHTITLPPGGSSTIMVKARPGRETPITTSYNYSIEVALAGSQNPSRETTARDFRSVTVFPLRDTGNDLWFRYPVTLSSRFLMRSREGKHIAGTQLEARGSGTLDTAGIHKLDFMARGPNNQELSFLGLYDEYYLAYAGPRFESFIGHKSFHVTPLMETARYGTGTQQTYLTRRGDRIGFLYLQPRFYRDIRHEAAAYAELSLPGKNSIGLHYLTKTGGTPSQKAHLGSITAHLRPFEATTAEFEYSLGKSHGRHDHAWRFFLNAHHKIFSLSASYYHAGQFYPGYYNNSVFYNGNFHLQLTPRWSLGVSAREDFANAATDTLLTTAPFSRMIMASSQYRMNRQLYFRLFYLNLGREDRMPSKQFDYRTESLNAEIDHQFNRFGYRLAGEYGQSTNYLTDPQGNRRQNSYRGSLHLTYKPSYIFNVQAFTSYTNINRFLSPGQQNWLWGLSAHGQPARNLRTTLQIQNSYAIEEYYLNRNLFQFTLDYRFLRRHQLSASSYYMLFQNKTEDPELTLSLTWSVQMGIPLRKTREAGSFSGTLTRTGGGPVKGVVFYLNGRTAMTDEYGRFSFRNLPPGSYDLQAGRDHFGIDEIIDKPMPARVDIHPGKEAHLSLQLVKAARIKGRITAIRSWNMPPPESATETSLTGDNRALPLSGENPAPAFAHVVLDLRDSLENIRVVTNADGEFEVPRIRPGAWTIRVYKNNIDPRYNLEKENDHLTLTGGESTEVVIRVLPKTRTVIFKPSAPVVTSVKEEVNKPDKE